MVALLQDARGSASAGSPPWRGAVLAGLALIVAFFGGFLGWAAWAPLSSAVISQGVIRVNLNRQTVQHLDGGIVKALLVRDGDRVKVGDVLVQLDPVRARASQEIYVNQQRALQAQKARLVAERDGLPEVLFPADLLGQQADPAVAAILKAQRMLFEARRDAIASQVAILRERIAQTNSEIRALDIRQGAADQQLQLINREIAAVQQLYDKGLERQPRLLALQRQASALTGERGNNLALIARAKQSIGEVELRIFDLRQQQLNAITDELRNIQVAQGELDERLRVAVDTVERIDIRAPRAGKVVDMRFHTPGGVIRPSEPILDIVPEDDELVIDAQIRVEDIDLVHPGQPVQVRLTAFSQRYTHMVDGVVRTVSADRIVDPNSMKPPHYKVLISMDPEAVRRIVQAELYPGMPAVALIATGERSLLQYLVGPLLDSWALSMREP